MEWDAHADVLAPLEPPGGFELRQRERRAQLAAVEDGLLRRGLFSATRPTRLQGESESAIGSVPSAKGRSPVQGSASGGP